MSDRLARYRQKRDFSRTPEPEGTGVGDAKGHRYVMHKHAASNDHFDLRLEWQGTLRSWAVPKGPSLQPGEKRLAIEVEDHPLSYGEFEGIIPKGEYGGGTIMLWDCGRWELNQPPEEDRLDFTLHGEKLAGRWTLVRTRSKGQGDRRPGNQWLLIKRSEPGDSRVSPLPHDRSVKSGRSMAQIAGQRGEGSRQSLPDHFPVQLATLTSEPPAGGNWLHEIKFDGYRLQARIDHHGVTLFTRNQKNWTHRFPAIADALSRLPLENAIIDGEIVALQPDGSSSFRKLQSYLGNEQERGRPLLVFQAFDLLFLDGKDLLDTTLVERKAALKRVLIDVAPDPVIRYSDHIIGQGPEFFREVCELGLEGMVSKRTNARYRDGRQKHWLKVKCTQQEEFVICGFLPSGKRSGFGSLMLGTYEGNQLRYAGRVGTGFTHRQLSSLHRTLSRLEVPTMPFPEAPPDSQLAHWVKPELVADIEFSERTETGVLRHPVFRGLRQDKSPEQVRVVPAKNQPKRSQTMKVAQVPISSAQRVLFPDLPLSKGELAEYYAQVADWMLPHLRQRPLSLLRCPEGLTGDCFFQKHPDRQFASEVPRIAIPEKKGGQSDYLYVDSPCDLIWLIQYGVLEIHPWGCRIDDLEHPDTLIFDLDPDPALPWKKTADVAVDLRDRLCELGLTSFLQATGGKGLHLVVPIVPGMDWDEAKTFARSVSRAHARDDPGHLTTNMSKSKRKGKVFIDYLRNGRGSTSIARYSSRAKPSASIATPIRWDELNRSVSSNRYTVSNIHRRLRALASDPWEGYEEARRAVSRTIQKQVNKGESE